MSKSQPPLPHRGDQLPVGAKLRLGTNRLNHLIRVGNRGVCLVVFSADSRFLLTLGYQDDEATLWEVPGGREVWRRKLGCGVDRMAGAAFSPDGRLLVVGSRNLRVFEVATGRAVRTLRKDWPDTAGLAFSPCGRYLAEARYDARVDLWAVRGWKVVASFAGDPEPEADGTGDDHFRAVAFSADGHQLAAGSDCTIKQTCRKRDHARLIREAEAAGRPYMMWGESDGGADCWVGRMAGRVWVWDRDTGGRVCRLDGPTDGVTAVHFLPDKTVVATAGDGTLRAWEVPSGRELRNVRWDERGGNPSAAAFAPDGQAVAVPAPSETVVLDVATGAELRRLPLSYYLAYSPNGHMLATAVQGRCHLWDTTTWADLAPPARHVEAPDRVRFSANGRRVLTAERSGEAFVWNAGTGALVMAFDAGAVATSLVLSPDGTRAAGFHPRLNERWPGGPRSPQLCVWDVATGRMREVALDADPTAITWSADGQAVLLACGEGHLTSYPVRGGRPSRRFRATGQPVRDLHACGRRVIGTTPAEVCVWDAVTGRIVDRVEVAGGEVLAISRDGRAVAVWRSWEVVSVPLGGGREPFSCSRPDDIGEVQFAALDAVFRADGHLLVAAGGGDPDNGPFTVRVWDAASGAELWRSPPLDFATAAVTFAPGGRALAVGTDDATTLIWDLRASP